MYIRNYSPNKKIIGDPTSLKGWKDVFETTDKAEVEEELRKNKIDFTWSKNDDLHLVSREAAVEPHPITGEKVWFNHSQVKPIATVTACRYYFSHLIYPRGRCPSGLGPILSLLLALRDG